MSKNNRAPIGVRILTRRCAPDAWRPSLLAGLIGITHWLSNPVAAYARERKQFQSIKAYRKLQRIGSIADFRDYPITALPPQYDDLLNLYLVVTHRKPKVVLELGGGYSTLVIARALSELDADTVFWSVDASEHWQEVVSTHMPVSLKHLVKYHHATPYCQEFNGETISAFETLPVSSANFVYIDGGGIRSCKQGGDALLLEQQAPDDYAILVDGRKRTVDLLRRALRGQYTVGTGPFGVQTLFAKQQSSISGAGRR
jgi:hypothetical protein